MSSTTRIVRRVTAPCANVYRALLYADAIAKWRVPTGMTCQVHEFNAREGGAFRVSLTYDAPSDTGKTTAHTDTYHGRFVRLVPNEQVVEVMEFETADPALRGEMTITTDLVETSEGGTDIVAVHDGLPPACVPPTTRRVGTRPLRSWRRWSRHGAILMTTYSLTTPRGGGHEVAPAERRRPHLPVDDNHSCRCRSLV